MGWIHGLKLLSVPILIVASGFICLEFAFPITVGEFIAGIIGGLFLGNEETEWMKWFSHLGLLAIMFLAGFEIDLKVLKRNLKTNVIVGTSSFFGPYLAILFACMLLGIPSMQSFVLAIALSTTSLAMVFTILRQHNFINSNQGQILLGSAMIVDILSMVMLSLTLFDFQTQNIIFMLILIGTVWVCKKIIVMVFQRYKGNRVELELKILLLTLPIIGILGEEAGIHGALIAFILGVALSDIDPQHDEIIEKLNTVVFSLLAPIFFFHAGTLISIDVLTGKGLGYLAVLGITCIAAKQVSTYFALYYAHGKNSRFAAYGGILFNYRLSFGIAAAIYASEKGVLEEEFTSIILLLVAISSIFSVIAERRHKIAHALTE